MFDNLAVGKKRKSFHKIVDDNYMNAQVNKLIYLLSRGMNGQKWGEISVVWNFSFFFFLLTHAQL